MACKEVPVFITLVVIVLCSPTINKNGKCSIMLHNCETYQSCSNTTSLCVNNSLMCCEFECGYKCTALVPDVWPDNENDVISHTTHSTDGHWFLSQNFGDVDHLTFRVVTFQPKGDLIVSFRNKVSSNMEDVMFRLLVQYSTQIDAIRITTSKTKQVLESWCGSIDMTSGDSQTIFRVGWDGDVVTIDMMGPELSWQKTVCYNVSKDGISTHHISSITIRSRVTGAHWEIPKIDPFPELTMGHCSVYPIGTCDTTTTLDGVTSPSSPIISTLDSTQMLPETSVPSERVATNTSTSTPVSSERVATNTSTSTPVSSERVATNTSTSTPVSSERVATNTSTSTPVSSERVATNTSTSTPVSSERVATNTSTSTPVSSERVATNTTASTPVSSERVATNTSTSTPVPSERVSTNTSITTSSEFDCSCCAKTHQNSNYIEAEDIDVLAIKFKEQHLLQKTQLNSYIRSKTSARDDRMSSAVLGYTSFVVIMASVSFIVSMDLPRLMNFLNGKQEKRIKVRKSAPISKGITNDLEEAVASEHVLEDFGLEQIVEET